MSISYKDLDGNPIPLDYFEDHEKDDPNEYIDCHLKYVKYGESKFYSCKVKIVASGSSDYDDGGPCYREYIRAIVHYSDEMHLVDVINAAEKLFTETSFCKNIDYIEEIQTLN